MAATTLALALEFEEGSPHPLGATIRQNGVNFSLNSGSAAGVELPLFDNHDSPQPRSIVVLANRPGQN